MLRKFRALLMAVALAAPAGRAYAQDLAPYESPLSSPPGSDQSLQFPQRRLFPGFHTGRDAPAAPLAHEPWSMDGQTPYVQRFGVGHMAGDGVGYRDGLTTIEFMTPLRGDQVWDNLFAEARFIVLNDATVAANLGLGYRVYQLEHNRIYGLNVFYDYRQTDYNDFHQVGVGVEALGPLVDFRANLYIPDVDQVVGPVPGLFIGHQLLTNRDEIAMTGGDVEAGVCLVDLDHFQARVFGGGYWLDGHRNDDAIGWRVRGEATLDQQLWVHVAAQHDGVFGTTVGVGVAIRYLKRFTPPAVQALRPMDHIFFRRGGDAAAANIAYRLSAPVERLPTIVLSQQPAIATDLSGTPLNFLHVVEGGAGDGRFENPYGTLTAALADPAAGASIIYTPAGGNFTENITLVAGTSVLSNGPVQLVQTQFGPAKLPFSGASTGLTDLPTLTGNVAMADDSRFSGFDVTGQVTAAAVSGFRIDHARIDSAAGDALSITGADTALLDNLSLEATAGRGLLLSDSSAALTAIEVTTASGDGIAIETAAADRAVEIDGLTISNASGRGVGVEVAGTGSLSVSLRGTNSISSVGSGVEAALGGASTGDLLLSIETTTLASTGGSGVVLDGSAGAGTLYVTGFSNNTVTLAAAGGFLADTVTFDADPATAAFDVVAGGVLLIGDADAAVEITGDGVRLIDPTGALDFSTLDVFNSGGTGLLVDTKGGGTTFTLTTGADSTIVTSGGAALSLDPLDVGLLFDTVTSTGSPGHGIFLDTVTGRVGITATTVSGSALAAIVVQNTPAPLSLQFGETVINSLISDAFADNIGTTVGNGTNLSIDFSSLTITGP